MRRSRWAPKRNCGSANAISPAHYDHGWHITGTCGVFGAAVAASALLGLDAAAAERALALAGTMTAGHREAFGSMTKPLHAGKAAANGVLAPPARGRGPRRTSGPAGPRRRPRDPRGPGRPRRAPPAHGPARDRARLIRPLYRLRPLCRLRPRPSAAPWELELNTFNTYPCGVVAHPAMDAAIIASARIDTAEVTGITLRCNPLVPELMGLAQDGLGSRFSARHGVAVALHHGRAGLAEFSDGAATAPEVARLRGLIALEPDPAILLQTGKAAFNAVEAAELVGLGFTSSGEPLDGRRALFALFCG